VAEKEAAEFKGKWRSRASRQLGFLTAEGVISGGAVVVESLLAAGSAFGGARLQDEEDVPVVSADAVVAADGQEKQGQPEDILALPAGCPDIS
jgi:hypothetical protein